MYITGGEYAENRILSSKTTPTQRGKGSELGDEGRSSGAAPKLKSDPTVILNSIHLSSLPRYYQYVDVYITFDRLVDLYVHAYVM